MADIKEAMNILMGLEFSSPYDALEKNPTETGYTYKGIYFTAHPNWPGWQIVRDIINHSGGNLRQASKTCYENEELNAMVDEFYKEVFWDKARLDELSQQKANEIFIFGVNAGMKRAIQLAQRVIGVEDDGVLGPKTFQALIDFPDEVFDVHFDIQEEKYYDAIIEKNPSKKIFARGWRARAQYV